MGQRRLLCICLGFLSACGASQLQPKPLGEALAPEVVNPIVSAAVRCDTVHSLRGLARAELETDGGRSVFRYVIAFTKPGHLRIEAIPTGAVYTLSLLTTRDGRYVFLDPQSKTAYSGPADASVLNRYLGAPLFPDDLMALLTGCLPPRFADAQFHGFEDKTSRLQQFVAAGVSYLLSTESGLPISASLVSIFDDSESLRASWGEFKEINGVRLPYRIELGVPGRTLRLQIEFTSLDVNGQYPERLFSAAVPEGYEEVLK